MSAENKTGCPVQLDCSCVFYGLNSNGVSQLTSSMLPHGTSLLKIIEAHELLIGRMQQDIASLKKQLAGIQ